jgi:hypothetical protein
MRHLLLAALTALFTATAAPAFAASMIFDVLYSGTVASDVSFGPPFPFVFGQNLTGKPFHVSESFNLANATPCSCDVYYGGPDFASGEITIGNVSRPIAGTGIFGPAPGGIAADIDDYGDNGAPPLQNGVIASLPFEIFFDPGKNGFVSNANLYLDENGNFRGLNFNVTSYTLVLSPVSAVPLPPALPLFAFALLALGIFGYVRRKREPPSMVFGGR